jgi:polysaccharide export outer membrane protein
LIRAGALAVPFFRVGAVSLLITCVGLASCASSKPVAELSKQVVVPAAKTSEYRIQPLDMIQIAVFNEPTLSLKARVSAQSTVNYPLLGEVKLAGLTVSEAEKKLAELLGHDYLVNPSISVVVDRPASRRIILLGQVKSPGSFEIPADETVTLLDAIARAGGFTDLAATDRVRIIRNENGEVKTIQVNVSAYMKSGDRSKDVELKADDVISVPETFF